MPNHADDWYKQAQHDFELAVDARRSKRHEWTCFAAQQAAEKPVKALHLSLRQEAWKRIVARLLRELPGQITVPAELVEQAQILDNFYIPTSTSQPGIPIVIQKGLPSNVTAPCRARKPYAMPVRSLHSSVFKWPNEQDVDRALLASEV